MANKRCVCYGTKGGMLEMAKCSYAPRVDSRGPVVQF